MSGITYGTELLPCELTKEELLARGDKLVELGTALAVAEEEKKAAAKRCKEEIEKIKLEQRAVAREIKERAEDRPTRCRYEPNFKKRTMETYREDTGAFVGERSLKYDELQEPLRGIDGGAGAESGEGSADEAEGGKRRRKN